MSLAYRSIEYAVCDHEKEDVLKKLNCFSEQKTGVLTVCNSLHINLGKQPILLWYEEAGFVYIQTKIFEIVLQFEECDGEHE